MSVVWFRNVGMMVVRLGVVAFVTSVFKLVRKIAKRDC